MVCRGLVLRIVVSLVACQSPRQTVVQPVRTDTLKVDTTTTVAVVPDSHRVVGPIAVIEESAEGLVNLDSLEKIGTRLYVGDSLEAAFPIWADVLKHADGRNDLIAKAHYVISNVYFSRAEYGKAEGELRQVLKADSNFVDAYQDLGLLQFIKGQYDQAEKYFYTVLEFIPNDSEATYWVNYTKGTRAYEDGLKQFNLERYDEAIRGFRDALTYLGADTTVNYKIYFILGKTYIEKLEYDLALENLHRCLEIRPTSAEAYTEMASVHFARMDVDRAVALCEKAIALDPEFAKAYNNLGYMIFTQANKLALNQQEAKAQSAYQRALILFEKALTLDPTMSGARVNLQHVRKILSGERKVLAYTMLQQAVKGNDNRQKIREYQKIIAADSTYDDAHNNLAVAYFFEGRIDSAVAALEHALRINPYNVQAHNNLGYMLGTQRRYDEGLKHLFVAIEIKRDYLDAYYNLGYLYMWQEDFANARKVWMHLLKLDPTNKLARKGYEELQLREKMVQAGESTLSIIFESDSTAVSGGQ